jgi:DeoR/GlpR family transcriptional regulator of sugar metabolism
MIKFSPEERHQYIIERLRSHKKVLAAELAQQFNTAEATIRRDLRYLAEQGICKRIHGGALSFAPPTGTQQERLSQSHNEKQQLARAALSIIKDNQLIFLDASSTHLLLASEIPNDRNITVVTNSPLIACRLLERRNVCTIQIGGELDQELGSAVDLTAANMLQQFRFDLCFLGVCAWSSDDGFSANQFQDGEFKRLVASRSGQTAVMCTQSKVETFAGYPFLASKEVDYLVCSHRDETLIHYFTDTSCSLITSR